MKRGVVSFRMAVTVLMLLVVSLVLCGCTSKSSSSDGSKESSQSSSGARLASSMKDYAQQLLASHALEMGPEQTASVKKVISTGKVSNSEYEAAWDRYVSCVTDKGYEKPVWYTFPNGIRNQQLLSAPPDKEDDSQYVSKWLDDLRLCSNRNLDVIQDLYEAQTDNPNLYADHDEGALDCLKRKKLVAQSITLDQYREDMDKWDHRRPGEKPKMSYDMGDDNVLACIAANGISFNME
ncbi:hypothetical protein [Bifidobacterium leontopitheci]|uniref:Lipoprotein n=1 Tax=Bifidobacterium leontopitheci TaxID=2650774 RepID=A0A6I1GIK8_9BIFI|nr:hypothetical protein [Bifidobacterium leontopitheci]KAB7791483.1 hypothetical protein F7D09_0158 [Bifidobacterium leontopitheci]